MTPPLYVDPDVTIHLGKCLDVLAELPDCSIDAVVTDPPYGIGFMGHEWDQPGEHGPLRGNGRPAVHQREAKYDHRTSTAREGAMEAGRYDLSRPANARFGDWCEAWARECLRVLKPGGYFVAFGGSRTWHRLAVGVEDAGFEIRDSIAWLYGSGFPKSLDVSKAVDKLDANAERRARALRFTAWMRSTGITAAQINASTGTSMGSHFLTAAEQPLVATADLFDAMRPLLPVVPDEIEQLVADRTVESENFRARQVVDTRSMPDATRVKLGFNGPTHSGSAAGAMRDVDVTAAHTEEAKRWAGWGTALKPAFEPMVVGRKPLAGTVALNVSTHGTGALNIDACRTSFASAADEAESKDKNRHADFGTEPGGNEVYGDFSMVERTNYEASGRWPTNVVLDDAAAAALGAQARFFPTFRYEAKAPASERPRGEDGTMHPTVKPLDLMRWLVRLATPPGGTVLDPFLGSGTTAEACVVEGFRCIGIERHEPYARLAVTRLAKPIARDIFGAVS